MNTNTSYHPPSGYYDLNNITPYQPAATYQNVNNTENMYPNLNALEIHPPLPTLSNNQIAILQNDFNFIHTALRSHPQFIQCPMWSYAGITKAEKSYSIPNLLCCLCFGVVGWLGAQAVRGKDINCLDAEHFCNRCGHRLGSYQAC